FVADVKPGVHAIQAIRGARVLALLGNSVTTDHISPAGNIAKSSPAGTFLLEHGVAQNEFNSYGARRGNDRVMLRGTFANIRIRNFLAPGTEGGVTKYLGASVNRDSRASAPPAAARAATGAAPPVIGAESMKMTSEGGGSRPAPMDTPEVGTPTPKIGEIVSIYDAAC